MKTISNNNHYMSAGEFGEFYISANLIRIYL